MKRLAVVFALILAGILALGATSSGAWFTDQETVSASLQAGKLDVDLREAEPVTIALDTTQSFKGGMAPGVATEEFMIDVYNLGWGVSTLPLKYRWTDGYTGGNTTMYDLLWVTVRTGNPVETTVSPNGLWAGGTIVYNGWLKNINLVSTETTGVLSGGIIDPNGTHRYTFQFTLASSAGNALQGESAQFNLVLDATQPENPGWAQ